jgi:hypothetical protein
MRKGSSLTLSKEILVSDLDIRNVERLGVAEVGSHLAVSRVRWTNGELNLVKGGLDVRLEVGFGYGVVLE